jgi:hypothetical protein
MKKVVFVSGYQGSGKSTAMNYFRQRGFACYSTSKLIHSLSDKILNKFTKLEPSSIDKETKRGINISVAEDIIKPIFGEDVFARVLVNNLVKDNYNNVCIETNGGDEFFYISKFLSLDSNFCYADSMNINMRSQTEKAGIDLRQLLHPATDLWFEDDWTAKSEKLDKIIEDLIN